MRARPGAPAGYPGPGGPCPNRPPRPGNGPPRDRRRRHVHRRSARPGRDASCGKVPTAARQEDSVLAAAQAIGAAGVERFTHGTTVATNALLERRGARTALRHDRGLRDVLQLRRQDARISTGSGRSSPSRSCRRALPRGERADRPPTASSSPLDVRALPELATPRRSPSACSSPSATPRTRSAVGEALRRGAARGATSSPRTRSRPSCASTSAPRRPPPTPTSARSTRPYLAAAAAGSGGAGLPERCVMQSYGGVATSPRPPPSGADARAPGPAGGVVGAARVGRRWPGARTRSRSTWAARPPTSA